ncbi:MAG TPA: SRPBCC family protein [Baekduia sp.]|nr:SRPBCC family protein [Baekduia sp.]
MGRFSATVVIDRPIEELFAFLADGENDRLFSDRVQEIQRTTEGPDGVGTVYASVVKDGGMKTTREFKLTEFDPPSRIRWTELSKNPITVSEGGYDLEAAGAGGTRLTLFNVLEGHGFGKLILPLALRSARNGGASKIVEKLKQVVEAR